MKSLLRALAVLALFAAAPVMADQSSALASGTSSTTSSAVICQSMCAFTAYAPTGTFPTAVSIELDRMAGSVPLYSGQMASKAPTLTVGPGTYKLVRTDISAYGVNIAVVVDQSVAASGGGAVTQGTSPWVTTGAGGTFPVTGTFWQATQPVSLASAPTTPVTCALCSTAAKQDTLVTALGSPFQAGGSIGNSSFGISGTLPAFAATPTVNLGTIGTAATAAKQPAPGTAGTASSDVITVQGIANGTPVNTSSIASTTGGWTSAYSANVTNTAVAVDASPGAIGGWSAMNNNSAVCYLQFFNTAQGSVTVGTTAPYRSIGVPANGGAVVAHPQGIVFSTAITVAATTTRAGSTACTSGMDITIDYK